jgi:outer membrane protein OmpA-like peptidoglycan-associated protein
MDRLLTRSDSRSRREDTFVRSVACALAAVIALAMLFGCKTVLPPKELLDARTEYQRAASGVTIQLVPADVHLARESLDAADKSFSDNGDTPETREKAYVAMRKAQLAEVLAQTKQIDQARADAQRDAQLATVAELSNARQQLTSAQQHAAMTEAQLAQERQARIDAEKRAKEALENLAKMASIKEESRGLVITLSGAVLFPSGQAALLPAAMSSLDNVVTALKSTPDRNITVEGHTDSVGTRDYNIDLSLRRADAVRQYLVSRGLPGEIVKAQGLGPDRPVASNSTPDGRANNRRVEIIVSPPERK